MTSYALLNKSTGKKLTHPIIGLWFTCDLQEAKDTLNDCHQYLDTVGLATMKDSFVIVDAESDEMVSDVIL